MGVHRALEAAEAVEPRWISAAVLDLRSVTPLDRETVRGSVAETGRLLVVDEDYRGFGLSGELEDQVLPSAGKITEAALRLVDDRL